MPVFEAFNEDFERLKNSVRKLVETRTCSESEVSKAECVYEFGFCSFGKSFEFYDFDLKLLGKESLLTV